MAQKSTEVSFIISRIIDILGNFKNYLSEEDVRKLYTPRENINLKTLVLLVDVQNASKHLSSNEFLSSLSEEFYDRFIATGVNSFSWDKTNANGKQANVLHMTNELGKILTLKNIESCISRFNTAQNRLLQTSNLNTLTRSIKEQLNDIASCFISDEKIDHFFVRKIVCGNSSSNMQLVPLSSTSAVTAKGTSDFTKGLIVVGLIVIFLYFLLRK